MGRLEILKQLKDKLKAEGYDGLYYPGGCACDLDDLAPCGEDYSNGCEPGYKHVDPRSKYGDFVVCTSKDAPTPDEFGQAFADL